MLSLIKELYNLGGYHIELLLFKDVVEYAQEVSSLQLRTHVIQRKPRKDPRVFYKVYRLLQGLRPDILHVWADMSMIYVIPAASMLGIPILNGSIANAPVHTRWHQAEQIRTRVGFPFSKIVVANSQAGLKSYQAPPGKSVCIYNGFDLDRVKAAVNVDDLRKDLHIQTSYVIAMIGAFEMRKDYETFVMAAIRLCKMRPDVTFLAVGEGKEKQRISDLVPHNMINRVLFPGMRTDIEEVLKLVDVGVLCTNSAVHGEGISNAILEFMASRLPVIATKGGGTNEVIINGETGFLIEPGSVEELTQRISQLLDDPDLQKSMGQAGFDRVQSVFSIQKMADKYVRLYRRLLD